MNATAAPARAVGGPRRKDRPEPARRSVERRSPDGTVLGTVELAPEVFGIEPNMAVLHQVVTAQLAAARSGTQSTRTRAEVAGGGVALGPKPRSYRQRTPKKMIRLALHSALSDRAAEAKVALVSAWDFEVPRTKDAVAALDALGLDGKVLVVLGADDDTAARSFQNLPTVALCDAGELNAYDVLRNDWVLFTDATLPGATAGAEDIAGADEAGAVSGQVAETAAKKPASARKPAAKKADEDPAADIAGADEAGALSGEGVAQDDEGSDA